MSEGWHVPPPNSRVCDLCGHVGDDVSVALHRDHGRYESIDRCRDHVACQRRLDEQRGEE